MDEDAVSDRKGPPNPPEMVELNSMGLVKVAVKMTLGTAELGHAGQLLT